MNTIKTGINFSRKEKRNKRMIKSLLTRALVIICIFIAAVSSGEPARSDHRILPLVPSHTELLFAMGLGQLVVGVTDYCNFPAETNNLPKIGNQELSIERIMSLRPTIMLDLNGMHRKYEILFSQLGLNYVNFNLKTIDQLPAIAIEIADIINQKHAGEKFAETWNNQLNNLETVIPEKRAKAYLEIWDTPMQTAGPRSFMGEILSRAGFINIVDNTQEYPVINHETVIQADPDFIFLAYPVQNPESVKNRPGWKNISAVKNNRVFCLEQDLFVRPGPRNLEGLKLLNKFLKK